MEARQRSVTQNRLKIVFQVVNLFSYRLFIIGPGMIYIGEEAIELEIFALF